MTTTVAAFVPMKSHSKRIPRKNFREFNGRPLYHWILHTLGAADAVDSVLVDTDCEELIEAVPATFDMQVVERPEELRGDFVSMNDIIRHDIDVVDADCYLQTHCTNPLLRPETVDEAVETFLNDETHDSLFAATPLKTRLWNEHVEPINHERDELKRTQDLTPVYEENSNLYLFTRDAFEKRGNRIADDPVMFEMEASEAVDIDEPVDFEFAELLHRREYGEEPAPAEVVA